MTSNDATTIVQVSERFNAGDSDVTFKSNDGVLFRVHRINLKINTAGFPSACFDTQGEIISLTESSATLELLFQFIYPQRQPDLSALEFEPLSSLTEAAEKYKVFSATNICKFWMQKAAPEHIHPVFDYAIKYGYHDVIKEMAPLLVDIPPSELITKLPNQLLAPWMLYYERWNEVLRLAKSFYKGWTTNSGSNNQLWRECDCCEYNLDVLALEITGRMVDPKSLKSLDLIFTRDLGCSHLKTKVQEWREAVEQYIRDIKPLVDI